MQHRTPITSIQRKKRYQRDYNSASVDIQKAADAAVDDLLKNPIPATRRLHALKDFVNPRIYTIDVLPNHSYKISLEIDGENAILRRLDTHKTLDRTP